ncbi:DUF2795 domain-containing protein [Candidatus Woesearchaeota archaeon]|nr:DUF2795 domain-containing protein [Candidatus Woesearchaeota archaeon]
MRKTKLAKHQAGIKTSRKLEMDVDDLTPARVKDLLVGMSYPITKEEIVQHAERQGADGLALDILQMVPEGVYDTPLDVSQQIDLAFELRRETKARTAQSP